MNCLEDSVLIDFIGQRLGRDELQQLDDHLDICENCRQVVAEFAKDLPAHHEEATELSRGSSVGRYIILDLLGGGSMGVVYSAFDPELNRTVALKFLRQDLGQSDGNRQRLIREAQALARLSHPNVVSVHDVGTHLGQIFLAMEYVEGPTLRAWLAEEERSWKEIVSVFTGAGRGLSAAHDAGLVHRDFKPDNVMIDKSGAIRVTDFGLALTTDRSESNTGQADVLSGSNLASTLTRTGSLLGTPAYMAPDQLEGKTAEASADQFSFGVSLFEALDGSRPFAAKTVPELERAIRAGTARAPRRAMPNWLWKIIQRTLQPDPNKRFRSMTDVVVALQSKPAQRRIRIAAASIGFLVLAASLFVAFRSSTAGSKEPPCQGAKGELAGVWDEEVKEAIRKSFLATGKPYAADVYDRVEKSLTTYSNDWVGMHTSTCQKTRVEGIQSERLLDLRMGCLSRRRSELQGLTRFFRKELEEGSLTSAVSASQELSSIADCANSEALSARVPLPSDPVERERIEQLQKQLDEVRALERLGREKDALAAATRVAAAAEPAGYLPLRAESLYFLAMIQLQLGDFAASEASHKIAAVAAGGAGDDNLMALISIQLFSLLAQQGRFEEATAIEWATDAAVARAGKSTELRVRLTKEKCALHFEGGQYALAIEECEEALELAKANFPPEDTIIANVGALLASALRANGRLEEALMQFEDAHAVFLAGLGPDHPKVAGVLDGWARTLKRLRRFPEALEKNRQALDIETRILGAENADVGTSLSLLASITHAMGRPEEAVEHAQRALEIVQKVYGEENVRTAGTHMDLGSILQDLRRFDEARKHLESSLRVTEQILGPDHLNVVVVLSRLGGLATEQGEYEDAVGYCERVIAADEKRLGPTHTDLSYGLECLARAQLGMKRADRAVQTLERSLAIVTNQHARNRVLYFLAIALWDAKLDRRRARALGEEALRGFQAEGSSSANDAEKWLRTHGGL